MWKEIGKSILKATIIAEGTKLMVEDVLPKAQSLSRKVWKRLKKEETVKKQSEPVVVEVSQVDASTTSSTHKPAKTKIVHSYDADYQDK